MRTRLTFHTVRLLLLICGAIVAVCTRSDAQVSLATVVDLAQRNSTAVRLAQADVNRAMANLSESKDVIIPSLLFSTGLPAFPEVGFTGTPPSIWSATVQSLVFSIPQKHYIDAARLGLQASTTSLKDAREQVALDASTAYIELDTVDQELSAAQKEEAFASRLVAIEQERAEAGVDPLRDLLQAKLTAAQIKLKREHLETRAATLEKQLAALTGLPVGSITPDRTSIPEIPELRGGNSPHAPPGLEASRLLAQSKFQVAKGDEEINYFPQLTFGAQYNRNTTILNSVNQYFNSGKGLPANNFSSGIAITVPIFDFGHRAKARESAADALRAKVEAEQAEHQNDIAISELNSSLQELTTQAEIASLQQQIAQENLKTVMTQLEFGNGSGTGPNAVPQLSPKAEQLARIDESAKFEDSLDAGFDLAKARLDLLRALGHMEDWLRELHVKQP
ncbi:MAG TPA: TolC family protein [Terracidiphilus sp.]|nr:TolC family protein [Terracidiphilus sp.]